MNQWKLFPATTIISYHKVNSLLLICMALLPAAYLIKADNKICLKKEMYSNLTEHEKVVLRLVENIYLVLYAMPSTLLVIL